ncbi:MAG: tRNA (N(6)-L-threonylcarbamoyladenosine(37)-C(2))-methylthiotransferase MtaB [Clostridia bacterium]|nr:tRNA (N(6)-L-threonylcarbamoyladenosine(37)-C(2))-methylthiotransferase MtaB [Clostridia bacterium]
MTFGIYTLGCRVNQYESRIISEKLAEMGYQELSFSSVCNIYIINSCAVTAESVRKSKQIIRRAKKLNHNAKIIVTGCLAQVSANEVESLGDIRHIIGNKNKINDVINIVQHSSPCTKVESFDGAEYENFSLTQPTRAREYIKIQDGCEGKCTYCVIPRARGPIRSKPKASVIQEVYNLADNGVKEIIFTGIEIASYEYDLSDLLSQTDQIDGIERISMGSLEPTLITEEFAKKLAKVKKLTPHFHISVQSGCTTVLNRMRRKYNVNMLEASIRHLREYIPHIQLTCDIIVGFPGESDLEFEQTKEFLMRNKFLHAHIFPYSKRPETVAAEMTDQIPENIKSRRCTELEEVQKSIKADILKKELTRTKVPVLFETFKNGVNRGHSDNYIEYTLNSDIDHTGFIIEVTPKSTDGDSISAE